MWSKRLVICKITDFGESRSELIQTQSLNMTAQTPNINRGTPAFMAPEIFLPERARGQHVPSSPEEGGHLGTGTHLLQPY